MTFPFLRAVLAALALLLAWPAGAATYNYNGSGATAAGCLYDASTKTYTCAAAVVADTDVAIIASGYTVKVTGSETFSYNQGLQMSGSASLQATGNLDISNINPANMSITGGTLVAGGNFKMGSQVQSITASITAASYSSGGNQVRITGDLTTSGQAALGSATTLTGSVYCGSLTTTSTTSISGLVNCSGSVDLASYTTVGGTVTAGTYINTNSPVTLNGALSATTYINIASGSSVVGNITAPTVSLLASSVTVRGDITATTSLTVASGNTVYGNVTAGNMTINASSATINGNVNLTGDLTMGSGTTINGNLVARDVTTQSSEAYISGNASVNSIYLAWHARVGQVISCTGTGANNATCSCVTNNSGYTVAPNAPVCAAPAAAGAHHIQITHDGSALTCAAETVSLKACADASCATLYNGSISGTLSPGGAAFTIPAGAAGSGTVSQGTAGIAALSASSTAATNPSTCVNSSNGGSSTPCNMTFNTSGLVLSVPDHVAETAQTLTILAKQASASNPAVCVPAVKSSTQAVNFSCGYSDPSSGSKLVRISNGGSYVGAGSGACSASSTGTVNLAFDANGQATASLMYADVGLVSLNAALASAGSGAQFSGSTTFTAGPKAFVLAATNSAGGANPAASGTPSATTAVFAKAGETVNLAISAVNNAGAVTPNFGSEATPEGVSLSNSLMVPSASLSSNGTAPSAGAVSATLGAFKNGSNNGVSSGTFSWSEVGVLSLNATIKNSSGYYMGKSGTGTAGGQLSVGRFVPDHFGTALLADASNAGDSSKHDPAFMACNASAFGGVSPCPAPNAGGWFVYSKQPYSLVVTAYNAANGVTRNYDNNFTLAKPHTLTAWNAPGATAAASQLKGDGSGGMAWSNGAASMTAASFALGVGTVAVSAASRPLYQFKGSYPDLVSAPTNIYVRASDGEASSARTPAASSTEALLTVVSGRALFSNGYGAMTSAMPVTVTAQYWNGSAYLLNPAYAQSIASPSFQFSNYQKGMSSGSYTMTPQGATPLAFSAGVARFRLGPPSPAPAASGSVDLRLLPSGSIPYINYLPDVLGRQVFGIYRAGPVVYLREVF